MLTIENLSDELGARCKQIVKLDYTDRDPKGWDAVVILSIFKSNEA